MTRKEFIKNCGWACLSFGIALVMLESCASLQSIEGFIKDSDLIISKDSFYNAKKKRFRKYLVVNHSSLKYPICVYRFDENHYTALLMQCTHQGAELQVFGDQLQCPAHGSEFDNKGNVQNGPADTHLRSFPVTISNNQIKISLKHV